jgi:hypothetical protein
MYESKHQAILPQLQFYKRLLGHCLIAFLVVMGSLCAGMLGFMYFEDMAWHDASMHAFFLLAGLGTITVPESVSGSVWLIRWIGICSGARNYLGTCRASDFAQLSLRCRELNRAC